MIIVGKTKPKLLNLNQIISLELAKGRNTAFVKGTLIEGMPVVESMDVRESWAIVVKTVLGTEYINFNNFDDAVKQIADIASMISPKFVDPRVMEGDLRKLYGKEKPNK